MKLDEKTLIGIEDYIQAIDENVGLKIETIKDLAQAITKHRGLVKKLTIPVVRKCTCDIPSNQTHFEDGKLKWTCFKCKKPS